MIHCYFSELSFLIYFFLVQSCLSQSHKVKGVICLTAMQITLFIVRNNYHINYSFYFQRLRIGDHHFFSLCACLSFCHCLVFVSDGLTISSRINITNFFTWCEFQVKCILICLIMWNLASMKGIFTKCSSEIYLKISSYNHLFLWIL